MLGALLEHHRRLNPISAAEAKGELVQKMIELLTVHIYIENEVMYRQ